MHLLTVFTLFSSRHVSSTMPATRTGSPANPTPPHPTHSWPPIASVQTVGKGANWEKRAKKAGKHYPYYLNAWNSLVCCRSTLFEWWAPGMTIRNTCVDVTGALHILTFYFHSQTCGIKTNTWHGSSFNLEPQSSALRVKTLYWMDWIPQSQTLPSDTPYQAPLYVRQSGGVYLTCSIKLMILNIVRTVYEQLWISWPQCSPF